MVESQTTTEFDAIILLCGGIHRYSHHPHPNNLRDRLKLFLHHPSDQFGLNFESSFKAKAASIIYQQGLTSSIISSGGPMWEAPPLGKLMASYLNTHRLHDQFYVPKEAIIEENDSTDSSQQVDNLLNIIEQKHFNRVGVVADSVHLELIVPLFKNHGLEVTPLVMESILLSHNPRYSRVIDKLHSSLYWRWWKFKYSRLTKSLEKNPQLSSPILQAITRFQRTKIPWLRLPGTT